MNMAKNHIKLSRQEIEYLEGARFLTPPLVQILGTAQLADNGWLSLLVSREMAEEFRSAFTVQLAKAGFDTNDELTREGEMLENLIDRFYLG